MKRKWLRQNWLWIIAIIAVIVVIFCACISAFRETGFAKSVLDFFKDWSVALSAAAAVILAFAAFLTIRHSNEREKRDRKERLLNEIIEWAVDVTKCGADINFLLLAAEIDEEPWGKLNLPDLQFNLRELKQRGEYVVKVASTLEKPLLTAAQKVESEIAEYLKTMDNIFIGIKLGSEGNLPMILKPLSERNSLVNCANNLLTEATKIKTRGIG
jgi:hypothetical protein